MHELAGLPVTVLEVVDDEQHRPAGGEDGSRDGVEEPVSLLAFRQRPRLWQVGHFDEQFGKQPGGPRSRILAIGCTPISVAALGSTG
ncbi:MAG: hypothetical protein ACRDTX_27980 [Pseudonocardiaceae bacterium]